MPYLPAIRPVYEFFVKMLKAMLATKIQVKQKIVQAMSKKLVRRSSG
jgi:hypothetical protein